MSGSGDTVLHKATMDSGVQKSDGSGHTIVGRWLINFSMTAAGSFSCSQETRSIPFIARCSILNFPNPVDGDHDVYFTTVILSTCKYNTIQYNTCDHSDLSLHDIYFFNFCPSYLQFPSSSDLPTTQNK